LGWSPTSTRLYKGFRQWEQRVHFDLPLSEPLRRFWSGAQPLRPFIKASSNGKSNTQLARFDLPLLEPLKRVWRSAQPLRAFRMASSNGKSIHNFSALISHCLKPFQRLRRGARPLRGFTKASGNGKTNAKRLCFGFSLPEPLKRVWT